MLISQFFLEVFVFVMILGKNWKYILADRLESDVDLRRAEGLVSEGCRFVGPHAFEGAAWSVVSENMSADVRGIFGGVASCPRMSARFTFGDSERDRSCPRLSAGCKNCYGGLCVVRACPRGVKVGESCLSADLRQVFRFSFNNHSTESFFSATTPLRGSATFHS